MLNYDVIIADDVRQEVSGKQTIVGMYSELMYLPHLPYIISQIAFLPTISGFGETPEKVKFSIVISEENNLLAEAVLKEDNNEDEQRWRTIIFPPMFLKSFEIKEDTKVKIQIFVDDSLVTDKEFPIILNPQSKPDLTGDSE